MFKSMKKKNCYKLNEEQNLRKVIELLFYIFLERLDEVEKCVEVMQSNYSDNCEHRCKIEILNLFDQELQLINNKPMIKNKLKECHVN